MVRFQFPVERLSEGQSGQLTLGWAAPLRLAFDHEKPATPDARK